MVSGGRGILTWNSASKSFLLLSHAAFRKVSRSGSMVIRAAPSLLAREGQFEILSIDLFDTLLLRPAKAEAIWLVGRNGC